MEWDVMAACSPPKRRVALQRGEAGARCVRCRRGLPGCAAHAAGWAGLGWTALQGVACPHPIPPCVECSCLTAVPLCVPFLQPQDDDVRHYVKIYGKKVEKVRQ